jgi:aminomethyltransferase
MLRTSLYDFHRNSGARLVEFAGWEMPLLYTSIVAEHNWTRQHCSLFDVSHMGRIEFHGPDATAFLQHLATRNVQKLAVGQCGYSHICRQDGGILDDVIISRFENHYLMVCNAANRQKLLAWFDRHRPDFNVQIVDRTLETAMVAIQGPEAIDTLSRILPVPLHDLKRYHFRTASVFGVNGWIARSGYTGEDGVEIIMPAAIASTAVNLFLQQAEQLGSPVRPAGLGARDTLRLEAGMPLYGHELSEDWDSITAGQAWCVDLSKNFIGRDALKSIADSGPQRMIVGLEVQGKRIARPGSRLYRNGQDAGFVTSGTLSPTLAKNIAMALVDRSFSAVGTQLQLDLRSERVNAEVVPLPFYKRQARKT